MGALMLVGAGCGGTAQVNVQADVQSGAPEQGQPAAGGTEAMEKKEETAAMEKKEEGGSAGGGVTVDVDTSVTVDAAMEKKEQGAMMAPKVVKVTAKQFTFEPAEIRVKQGEKVKLEITSVDVDHGFALPTFNLNATLKPNEMTTLEFVADKKGTFPFFCSIFCGSGHGSMRGSLIVE
jgi:cytochrome c oxidase subunit 2